MPNKLITRCNFKLLQSLSLIFTILNEFSYVFSLKGCAQPSSAWKKGKGAASFFLLALLILPAAFTSAIPTVSTDKTEYVLGEKVFITTANATPNTVMKIIIG